MHKTVDTYGKTYKWYRWRWCEDGSMVVVSQAKVKMRSWDNKFMWYSSLQCHLLLQFSWIITQSSSRLKTVWFCFGLKFCSEVPCSELSNSPILWLSSYSLRPPKIVKRVIISLSSKPWNNDSCPIKKKPSHKSAPVHAQQYVDGFSFLQVILESHTNFFLKLSIYICTFVCTGGMYTSLCLPLSVPLCLCCLCGEQGRGCNVWLLCGSWGPDSDSHAC